MSRRPIAMVVGALVEILAAHAEAKDMLTAA